MLTFTNLTERTNTNALRGVCALGILIFHIILAYEGNPATRFWGGMMVTVFLLLSGYGLHESQRKHGLGNYWRQRLSRVLAPTLVCAAVTNLLLPQGNMATFISDITYAEPTYWFVFHIFKWYAVYWVAVRFFRPYVMWILLAAAVGCFFCQTHGVWLEPEQSFSFLCGVWASEHKERLANIEHKKWLQILGLMFGTGLLCFSLKAVPGIYAAKDEWFYNLIQCPFRLSWGIACFIAFGLVGKKLKENAFVQQCGKYSLEIYLANIAWLGMFNETLNLPIYLALVALLTGLLVLLQKYMDKINPAALLFALVNATFATKYGSRALGGEYVAAIASASFAAYYAATVYAVRSIRKAQNEKAAKSSWQYLAGQTAIVAAGVGMIVVQYLIDPMTIEVDRWSALTGPIGNLLHGEYPYAAQTHLGGYASPFPVWQLLHLPFFLMGNVGLSLFAAGAFFLYVVKRNHGAEAAVKAGMLLAASVAVWYEASVRSDLMANSLLTAGVAMLMLRSLSAKGDNADAAYKGTQWLEEHKNTVAVVVALLACTRLYTLVPMGLLLLPYYVRLRWQSMTQMAAVAAAVFVLTFVPFALWDTELFFHSPFSPWVLQTRQGHWGTFLVYVPLALYLAFSWRGSARRYLVNTAVMLFLFFAISMGVRMVLYDDYDIFSASHDITYLSTLIPFGTAALGMTLREKEITQP